MICLLEIMKWSHCPYGHFGSSTVLNTHHINVIFAKTLYTKNNKIQKRYVSKWILPAGELVGASCIAALRASAAARLCSTRARWASLSSISARFALTKKLWDSQLGSLQPKQMLGNDIECDRVGQDTQSDRKLIMLWRSTRDKQMCVFVPVFFV